MAVQFAVFLGAEVYAVDMRPSSRDLALQFGARKAFDLVELDAELAKGFTVDVAIDFVSVNTSTQLYEISITIILIKWSAFTREVAAVGKVEIDNEFKRNGRVVIVNPISSPLS